MRLDHLLSKGIIENLYISLSRAIWNALFGLEGAPPGDQVPHCTLKTTQEKEMQ